jgi:HEPN domain-containing protein
MRPRDQALRELVGQWLDRADADLAVAKRLLQDEEPYAWAAAFHAQQAAEKFLKAVLVRRQIEFPKTHDLQQILSLVRTQEVVLADALAQAAALTQYAVQTRYPGQFPDVSPEDAREAVRLADQVAGYVRPSLRSFLDTGNG